MKFLNVFKTLWKFVTGDKVKAAIKRIDDIVGIALPVVKQIAALTPTRSDDELLALVEKYRVQVRSWADLEPADRGVVLLEVATRHLQTQFPQVPVNQLMSGVQLAVSVMKAGG